MQGEPSEQAGSDALRHVVVGLMGGTIDADWNGAADTAVPLETSIVPSYLDWLGLPGTREYRAITNADSRSLGQEQRGMLADVLETSLTSGALVTHGTYGMTESALFVEWNCPDLQFPVVFTGAWTPLKRVVLSDAGFNLGYAWAELRHLEPGVYICMNGETFAPRGVMKLFNEGRFATMDVGALRKPFRPLRVILMGGTIDFLPDSSGRDTLVPGSSTFIADYFRDTNVNRAVTFSRVAAVDSRDLTDQHFEALERSIKDSPVDEVIVAHGTLRMADTVERLRDSMPLPGKAVVFTGANLPMNFPMTDATFNLGAAMSAVRRLEPGFYIAFHGHILEPDEMRKLVGVEPGS